MPIEGKGLSMHYTSFWGTCTYCTCLLDQIVSVPFYPSWGGIQILCVE